MAKIQQTVLEEKFIKMLVYGIVGVGKTVFASTTPKPLFLDIEGGLLSIAHKKVHFVKIEKMEDLNKVLEFLKFKKHSYETVVIDSLTELQRVILDDTVRDFPEYKRFYYDSPSQGDWGRNIELMNRYVREFRNLNMHTIITCLPQTIEMSESDIMIKPALSGKKLVETICGLMDIIGYMYVDKDKTDKKIVRKMLFQPYKYFAKDRSGKLPLVLDNPTFTEVLKIIKE